MQLYVDALDRYIYYFEQGVEAVTPKYVNSLVELITSNIDSIYGTEGLGGGNAPGLVDGVNSPEMIVKVGRISLHSAIHAGVNGPLLPSSYFSHMPLPSSLTTFLLPPSHLPSSPFPL